MVRKREGWPQEGELVITTVTKIQYHSIFCNVDEYDKTGMIHISEIAAGRIKNVHEYLREGKTVVTKVLKVDEEKGHIDLSLRRVTEAQRRAKASALKQEQVVEKIISQLAEETKKKPDALHADLTSAFVDYDSIFEAFQEVVEGNLFLKDTSLDPALAPQLQKLITERISPRFVTIKGEFTITSYDPNGLSLVQNAFKNLPEEADVRYAGGGRYTTIITDKEYKFAEEKLLGIQTQVKETLSENAEIAFVRTDKK